jgi:hypothetical protein
MYAMEEILTGTNGIVMEKCMVLRLRCRGTESRC